MKVVYEPFECPNNMYVKLVQKCIEACGATVVPMSEVHDSECKFIFLNWYENYFRRNPYYGVKTIIEKCNFVSRLQKEGKKIVFVMHNKRAHGGIETIWSQFIIRFLINRADAIIIMSQETRSIIKSYTLRYKQIKNHIFYIPLPNYIDAYPKSMQYTRKNLGILESSMVYLFVGLVRPYKNIEMIINTAQQMKEKDVTFIITGKAMDEDYADRLRQMIGNSSNIRALFEFIPDEHIGSLIELSDVLIVPYDQKSSLNSSTVMLAFSYKRTVICPMIGTLKDINNDSIFFGYNYNKDNEHFGVFQKQVIEFYNRFYLNREKLLEINQEVYKFVKNHNSQEVVKKSYQKMFDQLEEDK